MWCRGDMIWAKHARIWYPAQICSLNDVRSNLQHWFPVQNNKVLVKWFGENNFSSVSSSQIDVLHENLVDVARAARSIMEQYNIALGKQLLYTQKYAVMKIFIKKTVSHGQSINCVKIIFFQKVLCYFKFNLM